MIAIVQNINQNTKRLSDEVSAEQGNASRDSKLRIGTARKALNLYLKYLWCLKRIGHPPPHCRLDFLILKAIGKPGVKRTELDSIEDYRKLVEAAKARAGRCVSPSGSFRNTKRHGHPREAVTSQFER